MKSIFLILIAAALLPAPTSAQTFKMGDTELSTGVLNEFEVPLLPALKKDVAKLPGGAAVDKAKVGLILPKDFDPRKNWPVFVVSVTSGGAAQPIGALRGMREEIVGKGWIGLAAEGPFKPVPDSTEWYLAMLSSALSVMHTAWPESRAWPYACGGFSGGAKRSGGVAAKLSKDKYNVIGMFLGGCNEDAASSSLRYFQPSVAVFKKVPIFLSSGTDDKVATPKQHSDVKLSMEKSGFKNVRLESFNGEHKLNKEHVGAALQWFTEQAVNAPGTAAPGGQRSSFDEFFKKK